LLVPWGRGKSKRIGTFFGWLLCPQMDALMMNETAPFCSCTWPKTWKRGRMASVTRRSNSPQPQWIPFFHWSWNAILSEFWLIFCYFWYFFMQF
jgi:hypothetical protein